MENAVVTGKEFLERVFTETMMKMAPKSRFSSIISFDGDNLGWPDGNLSLTQYNRIWVLGVGKAVTGLAAGLHELLGPKLHGGLIVCTEPGIMETGPIRQLKGNHPVPDADSIFATESLLSLCQAQNEDDLVIFLLTGGSSAMLCKPIDGVSLEQKQQIHKALLRSGASIHEMNTIRKHLSEVKGGKLLRYFKAKTMLNLIISDVPGDDPSTIGSGPVVPDPTTVSDVKNIIQKYIPDIPFPPAIPETVKSDETGLPDSQNIWIATPGLNAQFAVEHAVGMDGSIDAAYALKLGYRGSVQDVSDQIWNHITLIAGQKFNSDSWNTIKKSPQNPRKILLAFYGESEIRVTGDGKGGRNQHLALLLLKKLRHPTDQIKNITILSAGTDGIDGNTTDAGAIFDVHSAIQAHKQGLDIDSYLQNFDSNTFFTKIGDIFSPGPSGNNLMDLQLILIEIK